MTAFKPGKLFVCTLNQEKLTRKCAVHQCARIGSVKNSLQKLKIVIAVNAVLCVRNTVVSLFQYHTQEFVLFLLS